MSLLLIFPLSLFSFYFVSILDLSEGQAVTVILSLSPSNFPSFALSTVQASSYVPQTSRRNI